MLVERIAALEERTEKRFQELTERITTLEERIEKRFQELTERIAADDEPPVGHPTTNQSRADS